jgi:threonyl-tRNA synthetase
LQKIPFMLVVGDREMEEGKVAVRERVKGDIGTMTLAEFTELARGLVASRAISNQ